MECENNYLYGPYECGQDYVFNHGKCEPMDDNKSSLCDHDC